MFLVLLLFSLVAHAAPCSPDEWARLARLYDGEFTLSPAAAKAVAAAGLTQSQAIDSVHFPLGFLYHGVTDEEGYPRFWGLTRAANGRTYKIAYVEIPGTPFKELVDFIPAGPELKKMFWRSQAEGVPQTKFTLNGRNFVIHAQVKLKIEREHKVTQEEIIEIFRNLPPRAILKNLETPQPDRYWFIGSTDAGRPLRIVFARREDGVIELITALDPEPKSIRFYKNIVRHHGFDL